MFTEIEELAFGLSRNDELGCDPVFDASCIAFGVCEFIQANHRLFISTQVNT